MSARLAGLVLLASIAAGPAWADWTPETSYVRDCINAASHAHKVPSVLLVMLLRVEGGRLGSVSQNTNDTVDIGPMQVNSTWVHKMAQRWRSSDEAAFKALRDNLCANLEGGAWILRAGLDEARGDLWEGVAFYHSHSPEHKQRYLGLLWQQVSQLRLAGATTATSPATPTTPAAPRTSQAPTKVQEAAR